MKLKILFFTIFIWVGVLCVSGCHTVHGVGQDVSQGGKAIQKASS